MISGRQNLPIFLLAGFLSHAPAESDASILQKVLQKIDSMGGSPLMSVMSNLAESTSILTSEVRDLRAGDHVMLGYNSGGNPVFGTAGPGGLLVSLSLAAQMPSGLAAGLYPLGSALFSLPPAGQLSLYHEAANGAELYLARSLVMSRIDGTVTNVIDGMLLPELVPATLVRVLDGDGGLFARIDLADISTTVLGAVNAGGIVTNISAGWEVGGTIDLALAGVSQGADVLVQEAQTRTTIAQSSHFIEIGGGSAAQALALNLASSASGISGAVMNRVGNKTVGINEIVTTVIGAVNGGSVGILRRD